MTLAIHPETTVGALLEAYPTLEPVLFSLAPAFAGLRNPVLRQAVLQTTTLEQSARLAGVAVQQLVGALRQAAGQSPAASDATSVWLATAPVAVDIDADAMLARGVHPVGQVKEAVASLAAGTVVRLRTGFRPDPLIELMRRSGAEVHSAETSPGRHTTWFGGAPQTTT